MSSVSWHEYFMKLAELAAERSICSSRRIGAVLVRDNMVVSTGYNGPPKRSVLCLDWCIWPKDKRNSRFDLSGCPAAHAEANTINQAASVGASTKGTTLYVNCEVPCKDCLATLINAGVERIICSPNRGYTLYYGNIPRIFVGEGLIQIGVLAGTEITWLKGVEE